MSWPLLKMYFTRHRPSVAIQAIPGISNLDDLRDFIGGTGCYEREENLRIFEEVFAQGPRYHFQALAHKYHLTTMPACDAGCGWGDYLIYCHPDSYGIEVEPYYHDFVASLGLRVYRRDLIADDLTDLPKVAVALCMDVLEHLDSPHVALRKLWGLLNPGGLLMVAVPTIPPIPGMARIPRIGSRFQGFLHSDHINAFTPETLRFSCERAGFETLSVSALYPIESLNRLPLIRKLISHCVYVGRKLDTWDYPRRASRRISENSRGYVSIEQAWPRLGR